MKRILLITLASLAAVVSLQAQDKRVESNLTFNSGIFFECGSQSHVFYSSFNPLLLGHVSRIAYGLDIKLAEAWSLMPGVGLRAQTQSVLGMYSIGGDVDIMTAADAFCALRYHFPVKTGEIVFGLGPDVSRLIWQDAYYIDADPGDPRNGKQKFYKFDYGVQPSITFRKGKHWQFGLEANIGLRNMRIPYEFEYTPSWAQNDPARTRETSTIKVSGSTFLHTVSLTCGFHF